ncbi:tetratricopeptide repeat protein [Tomitella biformata]|uniref:tetratricopeptide repeat protein n=1 Tax=Tomitella biformata TaxID=630403 RepID=UPI0004639931|nr:tetratricopeptide repeat protein [Tomitella biformata]
MSSAFDLSALAPRPPRPAGAPAPAPAGPNGLAPVVLIDEANFEAEVVLRSQQVPVIVSLGTPDYPQCVAFDEILERAALAAGGAWVLAKVDVGLNPQIAQAFGVQSVPMVIAMAAGQPLDSQQGTFSEDELAQWLTAVQNAVGDRLTGPPLPEGQEPERDQRLVAAEAMLDEGDLDGGIAAYELILQSEPNHPEALPAVRQLRFLQRAQAVPDGAVEAADANLGDVDAQLRAADAELLAQQPDACFNRLIAVFRIGDADMKATTRARLLELWELFDPAEPFIIAARRNLANAMY